MGSLYHDYCCCCLIHHLATRNSFLHDDGFVPTKMEVGGTSRCIWATKAWAGLDWPGLVWPGWRLGAFGG